MVVAEAAAAVVDAGEEAAVAAVDTEEATLATEDAVAVVGAATGGDLFWGSCFIVVPCPLSAPRLVGLSHEMARR